MPGKPRKSPSKLDQILKGMGRLNNRVDGLAHDLDSFRRETTQKFEETTKEIQVSRQEIQALREETQQEFQISRQEVQTLREETQQEIQAARQETRALRQETMQRFDHQGSALQKQIFALADQIAANEKRDEKFRSDMLSIADNVVKKYEVFDHEKIALGAGQDRQQKEIDFLHQSDRQQNATLQELEGRVKQLEAV